MYQCIINNSNHNVLHFHELCCYFRPAECHTPPPVNCKPKPTQHKQETYGVCIIQNSYVIYILLKQSYESQNKM